jgi:hypothetical protein
MSQKSPFNIVAEIKAPRSEPHYASEMLRATGPNLEPGVAKLPPLKTGEATDIRPSKTLQNGDPLPL